MSAYHFYGNLDERFPTNDTKNFGRFGKNGKKKVTPLPFFPENVHRDELFKFSKFSTEFPRFSY